MSTDTPQTRHFHRRLESQTGIKLSVKINDNRSTMLSVKWEPDVTKVSLHRMFLDAPQNIMQALGCYLKGEHKKIAPAIRGYIEEHFRHLDYSRELDLSKLQTQGNIYNLREIYDRLNREYFNGQSDLHITWYGQVKKKECDRLTFGLFRDPLRLIKINRMLDHSFFPDYFVGYVVYHEMLHSACPAYVDNKGLTHIHSDFFKEREKKYRFYPESKRWIRENRNHLFNGSY